MTGISWAQDQCGESVVAADKTCAQADAIAKAKLADVDQRIKSLLALKTELRVMVEGCSHGHVGECGVIEVLADHGKCIFDRH